MVRRALKSVMFAAGGLALFLAFAVFILQVVSYSQPMFDRIFRSRLPSCSNGMKQIGLTFKMYGNYAPHEMYPPLSAEPGRLMWAPSTWPGVIPDDYAPDPSLYVCAYDSDYKNLVTPKSNSGAQQKAGADLSLSVDDWSYFYLGYAVFDDEDVATFADHYTSRMAAGEPVDGPIPLPEPKTLDVSAYFVAPDGPQTRKREIYFNYDTLYQLSQRLRSGLIAYEKRSVEGVISAESFIAVLIERPENHKPTGGHVLYHDGHVEFIEYPGKWPMTEKTIALLLELDALGADY